MFDLMYSNEIDALFKNLKAYRASNPHNRALTSIMLGSNAGLAHKILIKISNTAKYIKSNIQKIKAPRSDDLIIIMAFIKRSFQNCERLIL